MGKKHKHPEHENLERWLVSYADFITLLFAVFVVLYAMGQIDLAKLKKVQISISSAFSSSFGVHDKTNGILNGKKEGSLLDKSGNSLLDKIRPDPQTAQALAAAQGQGATQVGSVTKVQNVVEKINQQIDKINIKSLGAIGGGKGNGHGGLQGISGTGAIPVKSTPKGLSKIPHVQIFLEERGIVIRFASSLFFDSGSATMKPAGYAALDTLVGLLLSSNRIIHIEGHTDSEPIHSAIYPSNWDLSAARATSVIRFFQSKYNFPAERLAAVGYGSSRPLGDNSLLSGRIKNRRVDIVILYSAYSEIADTQKQFNDSSPETPAESSTAEVSAESLAPARQKQEKVNAPAKHESSQPKETDENIVPDLSKDPIAIPTKAAPAHH